MFTTLWATPIEETVFRSLLGVDDENFTLDAEASPDKFSGVVGFLRAFLGLL